MSDSKSEFPPIELNYRIAIGSFAQIMAVTNTKTNKQYAMKTITNKKSNQQQISNEIEINRKIAMHKTHPNILNCSAIYESKLEIGRKAVFLFEPICRGNLYDLIVVPKRNGTLLTDFNHHTKQISIYVRQIVEALQYCHENQIIHRDLKPENILLTHDGQIKLCDFGLSSIGLESDAFCGTFDYIAPEVLLKQKYDEKLDSWSLGVMTYELLCGHLPFGIENHSTTKQRILSVDIKFPTNFTDESKDFILKLLQYESKSRLSMKEALKHRFICSID